MYECVDCAHCSYIFEYDVHWCHVDDCYTEPCARACSEFVRYED